MQQPVDAACACETKGHFYTALSNVTLSICPGMLAIIDLKTVIKLACTQFFTARPCF